jgi:hypothetical protein
VQIILWHYPEIFAFAGAGLAGEVGDLHRMALTGRDSLESLLHFRNNSFYLRWRTSPEHKAMSRILEARFDRLVFQLCKNSVDSYTCKVWRGELLLLLYTSIATMGFIASLDFGLYPIRPRSIKKSDMSLQDYRGMLQLDRRMDCLIQWVLRQKDLQRCRKRPSLLSICQIRGLFPE